MVVGRKFKAALVLGKLFGEVGLQVADFKPANLRFGSSMRAGCSSSTTSGRAPLLTGRKRSTSSIPRVMLMKGNAARFMPDGHEGGGEKPDLSQRLAWSGGKVVSIGSASIIERHP